MGLSVARLESAYGIPGTLDLHAHDPENGNGEDGHSHDGVRLDMQQTRMDARAEIPMFGAFQRLNFRFGWADYRHDEIEATGDIGTSFFSKALEGRIELVQRDNGGWKGASGVQLLSLIHI